MNKKREPDKVVRREEADSSNPNLPTATFTTIFEELEEEANTFKVSSLSDWKDEEEAKDVHHISEFSRKT